MRKVGYDASVQVATPAQTALELAEQGENNPRLKAGQTKRFKEALLAEKVPHALKFALPEFARDMLPLRHAAKIGALVLALLFLAWIGLVFFYLLNCTKQSGVLRSSATGKGVQSCEQNFVLTNNKLLIDRNGRWETDNDFIPSDAAWSVQWSDYEASATNFTAAMQRLMTRANNIVRQTVVDDARWFEAYESLLFTPMMEAGRNGTLTLSAAVDPSYLLKTIIVHNEYGVRYPVATSTATFLPSNAGGNVSEAVQVAIAFDLDAIDTMSPFGEDVGSLPGCLRLWKPASSWSGEGQISTVYLNTDGSGFVQERDPATCMLSKPMNCTAADCGPMIQPTTDQQLFRDNPVFYPFSSFSFDIHQVFALDYCNRYRSKCLSRFGLNDNAALVTNRRLASMGSSEIFASAYVPALDKYGYTWDRKPHANADDAVPPLYIVPELYSAPLCASCALLQQFQLNDTLPCERLLIIGLHAFFSNGTYFGLSWDVSLQLSGFLNENLFEANLHCGLGAENVMFRPTATSAITLPFDLEDPVYVCEMKTCKGWFESMTLAYSSINMVNLILIVCIGSSIVFYAAKINHALESHNAHQQAVFAASQHTAAQQPDYGDSASMAPQQPQNGNYGGNYGGNTGGYSGSNGFPQPTNGTANGMSNGTGGAVAQQHAAMTVLDNEPMVVDDSGPILYQGRRTAF